jgi:hypothetical protein
LTRRANHGQQMIITRFADVSENTPQQARLGSNVGIDEQPTQSTQPAIQFAASEHASDGSELIVSPTRWAFAAWFQWRLR